MIRLLNSCFKTILLGLVHFYQLLLSPIFGGNCRFYPSCSEYCKECFEKHDVVTSVKLTFLRVTKCYPFGPSGFDPVPERKR